MRQYVKEIARFFRCPITAMALLSDLEYQALAREATDNYYSSVQVLPVPTLSVYERMVIANART